MCWEKMQSDPGAQTVMLHAPPSPCCARGSARHALILARNDLRLWQYVEMEDYLIRLAQISVADNCGNNYGLEQNLCLVARKVGVFEMGKYEQVTMHGLVDLPGEEAARLNSLETKSLQFLILTAAVAQISLKLEQLGDNNFQELQFAETITCSDLAQLLQWLNHLKTL